MCFSLYVLADIHFYKSCQAEVFSKFEVTLPVSPTASSLLGSSLSTQCSVNSAINSVH